METTKTTPISNREAGRAKCCKNNKHLRARCYRDYLALEAIASLANDATAFAANNFTKSYRLVAMRLDATFGEIAHLIRSLKENEGTEPERATREADRRP